MISILVAIAILFTVSGCSGTNASDKAVSVAKQVIETIDDYLDGKITYKSASEKNDDLCEEMAEIGDKHKTADFSINSSILILSSKLLWDNYDSTDETYADVVDTRNTLAKDAGLKKR